MINSFMTWQRHGDGSVKLQKRLNEVQRFKVFCFSQAKFISVVTILKIWSWRWLLTFAPVIMTTTIRGSTFQTTWFGSLLFKNVTLRIIFTHIWLCRWSWWDLESRWCCCGVCLYLYDPIWFCLGWNKNS